MHAGKEAAIDNAHIIIKCLIELVEYPHMMVIYVSSKKCNNNNKFKKIILFSAYLYPCNVKLVHIFFILVNGMLPSTIITALHYLINTLWGLLL